MTVEALLHLPPQLHLAGARITPQGLTLTAESVSDHACCPQCGQRSTRIHSRYRRTLHDLPAHGYAVQMQLRLRRFRCNVAGCPQGTFAEQLPQLAAAHARRTLRMICTLVNVAFTAGGEAGSRLADSMGMPVSGDTLLRLLRRAASPTVNAAPAVLGVDDFALRRGQVYGTILCDLEAHRTVDLLPERSSAAFAAWLKEHPGATIISRDRGGDYARGASLGAPDAIQVADRWHLLENLTDALRRAVDCRPALLSDVAQEVATALAPTPAPAQASQPATPSNPSPPGPLSRADQKKQASRQRRLERYQKVHELRRQGMGTRKIARVLGLSRNLVERFLGCQEFPERATPTPRALPIDAFLPYLKQRCEAGCDNVAQLHREIKGQGFTGSVHMVRWQVRQWRRTAGVQPVRGPRPTTAARIIRPSARRIAWLALGHVRMPTPQDELMLPALYRRWPQLQETAELCRQFASVLKERNVDSLEAWVQLAGEPGILPPVQRFAEGLRQDWAAVVEAVRQPWSQGQTEGQVNRLKLIKRQMYGRAKFDLLRQRVLHARPA